MLFAGRPFQLRNHMNNFTKPTAHNAIGGTQTSYFLFPYDQKTQQWGCVAVRGTTGISATYFVRQARHQLHLLWKKEEASASLTLWGRWGISVTYFERQARHQRQLLYEKGEASASLWETEVASASLTLWDSRGISITYFGRQKRHQRHITVRLTFLIHLVRMRLNFQDYRGLSLMGLVEMNN